MKDPWIAIAADYDWENENYKIAQDYVQAIEEAGGRGVLLPPRLCAEEEAVLPEWAAGLLLTGGPDIDPAYFKEDIRRENGRINPWRDAWELALVRDCMKKDRPVLGICRGAQVMAVAVHGGIRQDLYEKANPPRMQHVQKAPGWYATHEVRLEEDSRLASWLETTWIRVNSFHHQSVREGSGPFRVIARTSEGVEEAIEREDQNFWLGVQWHPERMRQDPWQRTIFTKFIQACRKTME